MPIALLWWIMKIKNLLKAENWWIIILAFTIIWMLFTIFTEPEYTKALNFIIPGLRITFLSTIISFLIAIVLGLISGIGAYLKTSLPDVEVVGCSPENSAVMMASVEAGSVLELPILPTLSDGTAGGIEPGALTFELCSTVVDRWIDVTESEISSAIRLFLVEHRMVVEGAAGVALAAFQKTAADYTGKRVAIIICGGNIGRDKLQSVLSEGLTPGPAKPAPAR